MRALLWTILILIPLVYLVTTLARFGRADVDRVEVTVLEGAASQDAPPQSWSLAPGDRQEVPFAKGARYGVVAIWEGKAISRGTVTDLGMGLTYHSASSAKEVDVSVAGKESLSLFTVNFDPKTSTTTRLRFLSVERRDGRVWFEFTNETRPAK